MSKGNFLCAMENFPFTYSSLLCHDSNSVSVSKKQ